MKKSIKVRFFGWPFTIRHDPRQIDRYIEREREMGFFNGKRESILSFDVMKTEFNEQAKQKRQKVMEEKIRFS